MPTRTCRREHAGEIIPEKCSRAPTPWRRGPAGSGELVPVRSGPALAGRDEVEPALTGVDLLRASDLLLLVLDQLEPLGKPARRAADREEDGEHLRRELEGRSEEHTSELQSPMRISYAVFC